MSDPRTKAGDSLATSAPDGAFSPLRHSVFAVLWVATVVGNVGTFMGNVASGWLATELSTSPAAIATIQAASTLPIFLLAIPAGALSDIVDRRKFLIGVQVFLAGVSTTLAFTAATGQLTVPILIILTFLGGIGAALVGPTWQSIVPELVPKAELRNAVALNSLGFNIARAIGPAVGGILLAATGAAVTYGMDALSYLFVIAAILWWRRAPAKNTELNERFAGAVRAGFRYALASKDLQRILFRAAVFFLFANVTWALLPLVAKDVLGGTASFYGVLLGSIGAGAVIGAVFLPGVRKKMSADGIVLLSSLVMATILVVLSFAPAKWVGIVSALIFGAAWIAILTTLNSAAQGVLPNWVRGRGLAVYLMAFNGATTLGALAWGAVGEAIGVPNTLLAGGICLAMGALGAWRFRLPAADADLSPSNHWPEPIIANQEANERGPVLVTIEYRVAPADRTAFIEALHRLSHERRRDGAYSWGVSEDATNQEFLLEWFFVESWAEHLRQHQRVTKADADLQAEVTGLHQGGLPPKVRHFLGIQTPSANDEAKEH